MSSMSIVCGIFDFFFDLFQWKDFIYLVYKYRTEYSLIIYGYHS